MTTPGHGPAQGAAQGPGADPGFRLPASAPEPVSRSEREAFEALVADSLPTVRAAAQAWRNGLTGLLTLVITGVVIQGRTTASELPASWRLAMTLLIGGGLSTAVLGLWQALAAEAGTRTGPRTLTGIHEHHASVSAYQVALANTAGRRLGKARNSVAVALALLVAGVATTWWAPANPTSPPAYLKVTYTGGGSVCGTLQSADGGQLRLAVGGVHAPAVIDLSAVTNVFVVTSCP